MYIKLEWTDEIGDIEEKEFWSWDECLDFVCHTCFKIKIEELNNETNRN